MLENTKPRSLQSTLFKTLLMVNGSLPVINREATLTLEDVLATTKDVSDSEQSPFIQKEVVHTSNIHVACNNTSLSLSTIKRLFSKYFNFTFIMACFVKVS